jgi:hypothetical protein
MGRVERNVLVSISTRCLEQRMSPVSVLVAHRFNMACLNFSLKPSSHADHSQSKAALSVSFSV